MIKAATDEITVIHAGRSSQDMLATSQFAIMREKILDLAKNMNTVIRTLITMAEVHRDTIVPNYTNGVAAQPNSYGHYLLAVATGFFRDSERLRQYYIHLNKCPMGTTVLNGSSWPLNRDEMAKRLGFAEIAYNAFDANQLYSLEFGVEAGYLVTSLALRMSNFFADIMQQYSQPRPWIILQEGGENTYVSSAMPQKRNPGIINQTRLDASTIIGEATGAVFRSHNIPPGMPDGRVIQPSQMVERMTKIVLTFDEILHALVIKPERALEELNLDWTASQEVADILMRKYKIPFRLGHHVASDMVGFARTNNLTPLTFPYEEVQRIYREIVSHHKGVPVPEEMPMSKAEFKAALDPIAIVRNRATKGGPQSVEMDKMLLTAKNNLSDEEKWLQGQQRLLIQAETQLNNDFARLI